MMDGSSAHLCLPVSTVAAIVAHPGAAFAPKDHTVAVERNGRVRGAFAHIANHPRTLCPLPKLWRLPVSKTRSDDTRKNLDALDTPTDLPEAAVRDISKSLNGLLADAFALYLKTKNFHWHVSGPHFRDYHLLLDEHAAQIFATTDEFAERVRKIGGTTLRSIGDIAKHQSVKDNNEAFVAPTDMLRELVADNKAMTAAMREAHKLAEKHEDAATAGFLETFIDQTERRTWFLFEASRKPDSGGH
jgi:starvation-inducible DNA-binding protein